MARANAVYALTSDQTLAHDQVTSTGSSNVQTITKPVGAVACLITVSTNAARVTFDLSTPDSTNGLVFQAAASPVLIPFANNDLKFCSTAGSSSIIDILWLE